MEYCYFALSGLALRAVDYVSDALVGNDDAILSHMKHRYFQGVRVLPIAVGASPHHYLIERAAELGRPEALVAPAAPHALLGVVARLGAAAARASRGSEDVFASCFRSLLAWIVPM